MLVGGDGKTLDFGKPFCVRYNYVVKRTGLPHNGELMKHRYLTILLGTMIGVASADESLILYLRQPPETVLRAAHDLINGDEVVATVGTYVNQRPPHKLVEKQVQGKLNKEDLPNISGFLTLYGGDSDISDKDGRIRFTLRHSTPTAQLVVTKHIKFELIKGETVSHTELYANDPAATDVYQFERKQDANGQNYWHVEKGELEADGRISPTSLVVTTNPANFFVPLGDVMTTKSPHLVLPPVYVVGRVENDVAVVQAMDVLQYLDPVDDAVKKIGEKHTQLQTVES